MPFFFGLAMGTKYELVRRPSTTSSVIPSSAKRKWRVGSSNGELMESFRSLLVQLTQTPADAAMRSPGRSS